MAIEFSVIVPTYNRSSFALRAVESVLAQSFRDFEVIVVDDGSTDRTTEAFRPYEGLVRYYRKANGGVSSARNFGIERARGRHIAFLDADDFWTTDKLDEVKMTIELHPEAALFYSGTYLVDAAGEIIGQHEAADLSGNTYERLLQGSSFVTSSVVARRECFEDCGPFYEGFEAKAGAEDWDMWIRISRRYKLLGIQKKPLAYYMVHGGNTSKKEFVELNRDILMVLDRAFEEDTELGERIRRKAYSNAFYLRGRKYMNAIMMEEARRELARSLKLNPFQLRAYGLLFFTLLSEERVRTIRRLYMGRRAGG